MPVRAPTALPVAAHRRTPMSFRALVEKSPAVETARYVHAPAHLPMAARHREIPCVRNENKRTRQPQILAGGGSPPRQPTCLWRLAIEKSPAGETKTNVHDNPKHLPAVAHRLTRGGSPSPKQKTSPRKERFSGVCNISFSRFYLILPFFILPHVARAGTYERSDLAAAINNYRTFAERTPAGARTRDRLPEPTYPYARNRS